MGGPTFEERIARLKSEGSKMGSMDLEAELQVLLEEHMALRSALDDVPLLKDISPGSPRRARSPDRIAQAFVSLDKTLLGISAILQRPVSSASSQRTRPVTDILDRSEQVVITKSVPYDGGVATFPQYVVDLAMAIRPYIKTKIDLLTELGAGTTTMSTEVNALLHQAIAVSTLPLEYRDLLSSHPDDGYTVLTSIRAKMLKSGDYMKCITSQQAILMAPIPLTLSPSQWIQGRRRARLVLAQFGAPFSAELDKQHLLQGLLSNPALAGAYTVLTTPGSATTLTAMEDTIAGLDAIAPALPPPMARGRGPLRTPACDSCGGFHPRHLCPYYAATCGKCGKIGHLDTVCRAFVASGSSGGPARGGFRGQCHLCGEYGHKADAHGHSATGTTLARHATPSTPITTGPVSAARGMGPGGLSTSGIPPRGAPIGHGGTTPAPRSVHLVHHDPWHRILARIWDAVLLGAFLPRHTLLWLRHMKKTFLITT